MKKNLTKKLMLSVLTLAFAVVSLGASTFAWFTLSGSVNVDKFGANVTGGYGLDISVSSVEDTDWDATKATWYSGNLPLSAITEVIGSEAKFDAVTPSSANSLASFEDVNGEAVKLNKSYIAFNLNFKITDAASVNQDLYLYLDKLAVTNTVTPTAWTADMAYLYGGATEEQELEGGEKVTVNKEVITAGTKVTYDVLSAARFAVVNGDKTTIYENNGAATPQADGKNSVGFSNYGAVDYYNKKLNLSEDKDLDVPATEDQYSTVKLDSFTKAEQCLSLYTFGKYDSSKSAAENTADDIVTITVYVWVEGWDAECINAIFNQNITVEISCAIYKKVKEGETETLVRI